MVRSDPRVASGGAYRSAPGSVLWALTAIVALWPSVALAAAPESADLIAACEAEINARPTAYEPYLCLLRVGQNARFSDAARRRLEEYRQQLPAVGWPTLVLGHLELTRHNADAAFDLYGAAIERFAATGEATGEILARGNRRLILTRNGRFAEAAEEVDAARRAASGSEDLEARTRALVVEGTHLMVSGGELIAAHALLRQAADMALADGPYGLKRTILLQLARLAMQLARYDEALATYGRLEELMRAEGDEANLALVSFNRANARQAQLEQSPEIGGLDELRQWIKATLAQAERTGDEVIAVRCHALLARIEATSSPAQARHHLARCKQGASALDRPYLKATCLQSQAALDEQVDPQAALAATTEALTAADSSNSGVHRAYAWQARMRAAWAALPMEAALAEGRRALTAIETLRDAQRDAADRARVLGNWTLDYSWLAGRVLASDQDPAAAFAILERLRARVLLESIHQPAPTETEALLKVKRRAAAHQRKLLDPALSTADRRQTLTKLERVELEQRLLLAEAQVEQDAAPLAPAAPQPISLESLQASLRPEEALLTFQVDAWVDLFGAPAGGSWVLVVTRDTVHSLRLPDRHRLSAATSALRGLVVRRDGSETDAAAELGRQLLREAVALLPPSVERLILVLHGVLHHLPFAALRLAADDLPLGVRYELVVAPSATLWHQWRSNTLLANHRRRPALVLADPTFPHSQGTAEQRGGVWVDGLRLGRLPQARREGRAIRRHLGGDLLVGNEASEKRLKSEFLPRYAVLHVAAHAIADLRRPERSCLLLAPGHHDEDGLLRASEVADLNLFGSLVVLSACNTSHGEVLQSEGLMSLARAFFVGGAVSVVGSRWPLADADAADFFDAFYRHLAAGESVATALRSVRREGYEAGNPAQAWAGPVLLGNGEFRIEPRRRAPNRYSFAAGLGASTLLAALMIRWWKRPAS